jgi:CHAT domain-containing protein
VPSEAVAEHAAAGQIVILKGDGDSGLPGVEWEARQLAERAARHGWPVTQGLDDAHGSARLRILHVGGHGWADRLVPADSTLHLAAPGGWRQVPIPVALAPRSDLVVLAACETAAGAGSDWRMDQIMAARMTSAGSRRVLAHLWPVGDMPSARLHDAFYRALFDGAAAEDALAAAQRASIASPRDHRAHDWASAVMFAALPRTEARRD